MVTLKKDESVVIIGLGNSLVMHELTETVNKSLNQQEKLIVVVFLCSEGGDKPSPLCKHLVDGRL